jgi:predicted aminopeptidase
MSPLSAGSPGVEDFLGLPLNFGDPNAYQGKAYQDIPTDFNVDPGVARRHDLAEQAVTDRYNSAFSSGVPTFIRQANMEKELRAERSNAATEDQQAQYQNQQLKNQALTTRAQMADQSELNKANMANNIASQTTAADLERRRLLLPQLVQTGGNSSGSGYGTQVVQQPGFLNSFLGAAGQVGSAAVTKI